MRAHGKMMQPGTTLYRDIEAHAASAWPLEACGVVVGWQAIRVPNVHPEPAHYFDMDPVALMAIYEEHGDIDGMYHSHPTGMPSPSDADLLNAPPGKRYIIAAPTKESWTVWEWSIDGNAAEATDSSAPTSDLPGA